MAGPENFIQLAAKRRSIIDFQGDALLELALAGLLRSGAVNRHINKVVRIYRERRDHFCGLLDGLGGGRIRVAGGRNGGMDEVAGYGFAGAVGGCGREGPGYQRWDIL